MITIPYTPELTAQDTPEARDPLPRIPVLLTNPGVRSALIHPIIDSGSPVTHIPFDVAEAIGLRRDQLGQPHQIVRFGDSARAPAWRAPHSWYVNVCGYVIELLGAMVSDIPVMVLGRQDVFRSFQVHFDERAGQVNLEPYRDRSELRNVVETPGARAKLIDAMNAAVQQGVWPTVPEVHWWNGPPPIDMPIFDFEVIVTEGSGH